MLAISSYFFILQKSAPVIICVDYVSLYYWHKAFHPITQQNVSITYMELLRKRKVQHEQLHYD